MKTIDNLAITALLNAASSGDKKAEIDVMEAIYSYLKGIAANVSHSKGQHSPTLLVNESYLRIFGSQAKNWENRKHFYNYASKVIRNIIVDKARKKASIDMVSINDTDHFKDTGIEANYAFILDMESALNTLGTTRPRWVKLIEFHFFSGFSIEDTAQLLGISERSAYREWKDIKNWLKANL